MKQNGNRTAERGTALMEGKREPAARADQSPSAPSSVTMGTLAGINEGGFALVSFPGGASLLVAKHVCPVQPGDVGRDAVLSFENGDPRKPLILGLVEPAILPVATLVDVSLDGERLTLTAKEEIVLRCGKASITLTRAGKVLIRGAYVLSRSSGVNRIKGGSVQIN